MKISQIIWVFACLAVVAVSWRLRAARLAAPDRAASAAALEDRGPVLPPVLQQPGLVSRCFGPLRVYLAVAPEVTLETKANDEVRSPVFGNPNSAFPTSSVVVKPATREWSVRAESLPILIVLENDTYQPLRLEQLNWSGKDLYTVRVVRRQDSGDEEVYTQDVPLPERGDWWSAERRCVEVNWPLRDAPPGDYRVFVKLSFGEHPTVEIATHLQ